MKPMLQKMREVAAKAGRTYAALEAMATGEGEIPQAVTVTSLAGTASVRIYGPLISGLTFDRATFEDELNGVENLSTINVTVDSPGGFLSDGISAYHVLSQQRQNGTQVNTEVSGLAASAAVFPVVAGDERVIQPGSSLMIHPPYNFLFVLANLADGEQVFSDWKASLQAAETQMGEIVVTRTKLPAAAVQSAFSSDTWYNTAEALEAGLVTAIAEEPSPNTGSSSPDAMNQLGTHARNLMLANLLRSQMELPR